MRNKPPLPSTGMRWKNHWNALSARGGRSSNKAYRELTLKYNKMPQNPKAG